jgi:hypothetical protein
MDAFCFHPKLWTKKKFWTVRGGEDSPSPNSILWDLDVGRRFWLPVEMLLVAGEKYQKMKQLCRYFLALPTAGHHRNGQSHV